MSILLIVNKRDEKFSPVSLELVSYGAALAKQLNLPIAVASLGEVNADQAQQIAHAGVSQIISIQDPVLTHFDEASFSQAIGKLADIKQAQIILMAQNARGKALAPRLSVKLKASYVSGVDGLPIQTAPLVFPRKAFTGKAIAHVKVLSSKCVLTLSPNSYKIVNADLSASLEVFNPNLDASKVQSELIDSSKNSDQLVLTEAEIVVSGGRGMKKPENWGQLEELAKLLGAATACSRPVADENWRPEEEHVGQTGKIVAPKLYFALGISGAIQHLGGISSSKCIVAVNKDPEAPIFKAADYGVIGDLQEILPELIQSVKKFQS